MYSGIFRERSWYSLCERGSTTNRTVAQPKVRPAALRPATRWDFSLPSRSKARPFVPEPSGARLYRNPLTFTWRRREPLLRQICGLGRARPVYRGRALRPCGGAFSRDVISATQPAYALAIAAVLAAALGALGWVMQSTVSKGHIPPRWRPKWDMNLTPLGGWTKLPAKQ